MENQFLHEVAITAIIIKDGKYLITRRSMQKKRSPGKWTVPGGKLETKDYINSPKDSENCWYSIIEKVLRREVKEETGLEVKNIDYVTSMAIVHPDGAPSLIISCSAEYASGEVKLQEEETDKYAWVSAEEAKKYDLLDGIWDELMMLELRKKGKRVEWRRFK